MSSSFLYTLTNRWSPPSSPSRFSRIPGYCSTRELNTSPTVWPSALTDACPSACVRSNVGSFTSTATARGYKPRSGEHHRHLGDRALSDAKGPEHRRVVAQAHDHVDPRRVHGLANIGRAREGVGVRVRVPHAHDVVASRLHVTHRAEH